MPKFKARFVFFLIFFEEIKICFMKLLVDNLWIYRFLANVFHEVFH